MTNYEYMQKAYGFTSSLEELAKLLISVYPCNHCPVSDKQENCQKRKGSDACYNTFCEWLQKTRDEKRDREIRNNIVYNVIMHTTIEDIVEILHRDNIPFALFEAVFKEVRKCAESHTIPYNPKDDGWVE